MSSVSDSSLNCLYAASASNGAERLLAQLRSGDPVVFLGPATTLARPGNPDLVQWAQTGAELYALDEDLAAHGVGTPDPAVQAVSYADWVKLSERFRTQTLWR